MTADGRTKFAAALGELKESRENPTLRDLAEATGISKSNIFKIFAGQSASKWDTIEALITSMRADPADYRALWEAAAAGFELQYTAPIRRAAASYEAGHVRPNEAKVLAPWDPDEHRDAALADLVIAVQGGVFHSETMEGLIAGVKWLALRPDACEALGLSGR